MAANTGVAKMSVQQLLQAWTLDLDFEQSNFELEE